MTKPKHNKVLSVPEPGKIEFVDRPYPRVKPGSVLVKTEIAAVCVDDRMYTDHVHEWFDHPIYGVGHEGVGTVVEAPDSVVFKQGDKVLISHGGYCGRGFACLNSLSQAHCTSLVGGGPRAGSSTSAPEFFVDGLAPVRPPRGAPEPPARARAGDRSPRRHGGRPLRRAGVTSPGRTSPAI